VEVLYKPDWEALKTEYVTTDISSRSLADKYGVSRSTLMKRAASEKWSDARKQYKSGVVAKAVKRVQARDVNKLSKLRSAADQMAGVINNVFKDSQQFNRHIITEGLGMGATSVYERVYEKADAKAIRDLAGAIKDLTAAMRNLYDIPTVTEKAGMDMAKERLELDRTKSDRESNTTTEVRVVIEAEKPGENVEDYGG
jgi:CRISPR/Cas system-associated protein endoribonuclease Cas2